MEKFTNDRLAEIAEIEGRSIDQVADDYYDGNPIPGKYMAYRGRKELKRKIMKRAMAFGFSFLAILNLDPMCRGSSYMETALKRPGSTFISEAKHLNNLFANSPVYPNKPLRIFTELPGQNVGFVIGALRNRFISEELLDGETKIYFFRDGQKLVETKDHSYVIEPTPQSP